MTKQLANLLSQHQAFDQQVANKNQTYVTQTNSHQSNKSYPSNSHNNVPLSNVPIIGHGHSSTFEKPINVNSILVTNASNFPQDNIQNISSDQGRALNDETQSQIDAKLPMHRIGSQKRPMQKNNSTNVLSMQQQRDSIQEASRKSGHKNTASFLTKFAAEELSNRAQYQMFNKPPSQTLETPTGGQNFEIVSNPQSRRNAREIHQQRLQLAASPNQSQVPDFRQRTVSYGAKFAAAGPASSHQIGFQNELNRSIVAGKSVDIFRVPPSESFQNSQQMEDSVAQLISKPPKKMQQNQMLSNGQDYAIVSKTFDNRKLSREESAQPGGSEKVQHRAPSHDPIIDFAQQLIEQASQISKKLIKAASRVHYVIEESKEIVKTVKQLNQVIENALTNGKSNAQIDANKVDYTLVQKVKQTIWHQTGAVTLIKLLKHPSQGVAYASLQLLNQLSERDVDKQQLLVSAGLIPIVIRLSLLAECVEVSERELRVEIAYFIGQVFQDSKQLIDQYLACEGYRIQLAFLSLPYEQNTDLVMIAIDSFLVIFEECLRSQQSPDQRKRSRSRESKDKESFQPRRLDQHGIASILIQEGLVSKLVRFIPLVIKHADLSTSHKDQSNAETIIERIFDVLINLAMFSGYHDKKQFSDDNIRINLSQVIVEQTKDPQQLTFLTTRQLLKLLQTLTSLPKEQTDKQLQGRVNRWELDATQQTKIIKKLSSCGFVAVQVEILHFYMGLIDHIQLSSIYDCLKLLNTFCKASADNCNLAMDGNGLVFPLKHLLVYIESKQDAISLGKRIRLLTLILSILSKLVSAGQITRDHLTGSKIYVELLVVLRSASKFGSGLNQMSYHAQDLADTSRNAIQTGLAIHLHQQSLQGPNRKPSNELALKVMEIFVDWIQKENDKSQKVQNFLAQKSSLESIFNVFVSPVKRNPSELLTFLISLHKMLLASDILVETLFSQDLLVSHLQSQMVLICNQMDQQQFARRAQNEPLIQLKNAGSTKSAIVPTERSQLQGSSSFYELRNGIIGVTPTNVMLSSLSPDQLQVPNTAHNLGERTRQVSSLAGTTEQPLSTQLAGQLLKELLEIFWLLLVAKKANEPLSYLDFVIKFDLADTVTMLQRQAQRKQLDALEELATGLLSQMFPSSDQIECDNLSGTFNVRKGGQGSSLAVKFSAMQPVDPVENIDDAPLQFNDSRIESSDGDQEDMILTPSSSGLSMMFQFNKSASNRMAVNTAKDFQPVFKSMK